MSNVLTCICGAKARDTAKERGRFRRRHPKEVQYDTSIRDHHLSEVQAARLRAAAKNARKEATK